MSSHHHRYSKRELQGSMHVDYVMSVSDLGLVPGTNRWEVLRAFLNRGEGRAERLVEGPRRFSDSPEHSRPAEYWRDLRLPGTARRVLPAQLWRAGRRPRQTSKMHCGYTG